MVLSKYICTELENSCRFGLKISLKIPAQTPKKNTRLFTAICRGTASHNVYLTENLKKLNSSLTIRYSEN